MHMGIFQDRFGLAVLTGLLLAPIFTYRESFLYFSREIKGREGFDYELVYLA